MFEETFVGGGALVGEGGDEVKRGADAGGVGKTWGGGGGGGDTSEARRGESKAGGGSKAEGKKTEGV